MRLLLILVLWLVVYQAPVPTFVIVEGFACRSPELWIEYATAVDKRDGDTIRNIRLPQRCVDWSPGEVEVVRHRKQFLEIKGRAGRNLFIPRSYVIQ